MTKIEEIDSALGKRGITLIFIEDDGYNGCLLDLSERLSKKYKRVVYVALNRPAPTIASELEKRHVDVGRFHFIDMISTSIRYLGPLMDCVYVTTRDLKDLGDRISESLRGNSTVFLLDSFHTLMAYEKKMVVTKFVHDLISNLEKSKRTGVLPTIESDKGTMLVQDLEMFVDEVVAVECPVGAH